MDPNSPILTSSQACTQVLGASICTSASAWNSCNENFRCQGDYKPVYVTVSRTVAKTHELHIALVTLASRFPIHTINSEFAAHFDYNITNKKGTLSAGSRWRPHLHSDSTTPSRHRTTPSRHPPLPSFLNSLVIIVYFIIF